jgi:hypothetical protein
LSIQRFSSPREYRDNNSGLHCQGSITVKFDFADPPLTHAAPIPGFDLDTALRTLNIARIAFDEINGNVQGFARQHEIGINPLAALPHKTTFHEIAHVVLGHTTSPKTIAVVTIVWAVASVVALMRLRLNSASRFLFASILKTIGNGLGGTVNSNRHTSNPGVHNTLGQLLCPRSEQSGLIN